MRSKWFGKALLAGLGVALVAGMALAQAPDWEAGRRGRGDERPGNRMWRGAGRGLEFLIAVEVGDVEVANTDDGVKLTVKVTEAGLVEKLQQHVQRSVDRTERLAERIREQTGGELPEPAKGQRGLLGLLVAGEAHVSVENTDDGVAYSIISEKPEVVQMLQRAVPGWVDQSRVKAERMKEQRVQVQRRRKAMRVLSKKGITLAIEETEGGITVKVLSDDPETAAEIQEALPAYFEGVRANSVRAREAREKAEERLQERRKARQARLKERQAKKKAEAEAAEEGERFGAPEPPEEAE